MSRESVWIGYYRTKSNPGVSAGDDDVAEDDGVADDDDG